MKLNNINQSWELEKSVSDECDQREREKGSYREVWESEANTKGNIYLMGEEDDDVIVTTERLELLNSLLRKNFQPKSFFFFFLIATCSLSLEKEKHKNIWWDGYRKTQAQQFLFLVIQTPHRQSFSPLHVAPFGRAFKVYF